MSDDFSWRDGDRVVRFGPDVAAGAAELLESNGFGGFVLLTTERAVAAVPCLADRADSVVHVPAGKVDEISAGLLGGVPGGSTLVALGGGRVVDTAKALAGAVGGRCAAIPTTLSGAEMTPFHRLPAGAEKARMVRPALVIADPDLMASAPLTRLAASAMNALAHAMEALYTPLRSPVTDIAALRATSLLGEGVTQDPPGRGDLALGALLAGYASGSAGIAFHHALCQSVVRTAGTPHAETNAVVLPHSARLMAGRAPGPMSDLARALGDGSGDPEAAAGDISRLAARSRHTPLRSPVTDIAALRATSLLGEGVTHDPPGRGDLALGALLAGYASGSAGIAFHHALCQSVVRTAGTPHAETNAVVLPHSARLMAGRAPGPMSDLARALGDGSGDPEAAAGDISRLAARSGHTRLATLGVTEEHLPAAAAAAAAHPGVGLTPDPPGEDELLSVLRKAL